jgi:hypothetical protein
MVTQASSIGIRSCHQTSPPITTENEISATAPPPPGGYLDAGTGEG